MLIGTAGHIDHGKTALVKSLTGVDADRLPEEKARGITIDLGYAYSPDGRLAFVDVPGHDRLVHNMLAGATGIDFVLLVVAADDGLMPQTREHAAIFDLLGVTHGAVVLTKADVTDAARIAQVESDVRMLLHGTGLSAAPVFVTSTRTGMGIAALRAYLEVQSVEAGRVDRSPGFRLAIDRCFAVAGAGTVVTGTVHAGEVAVDDSVVLSPPGVPLRVRGLHASNRAASRARVGQRCALNLTGEGFSRGLVERGQWILKPSLHRPTQRLDARLRLLASEGALRHWTPVHFHLGSAHVTGRVALLESDVLAPGEVALAQLVLDSAIGALHGDRFVIRDASASRTLGGGSVIDPFAGARGRRGKLYLDRLRALGEIAPERALIGLVEQSLAGVSLSAFCIMRNWHPDDVLGRLHALADVEVLPAGDDRILISKRAWADLKSGVLMALASAHDQDPDLQGVSRERLRRMLGTPVSQACFDVLVMQLANAGELAQTGAWLHLPAHRARLAPEEERLWSRISPLLEQRAEQPPRVRDLAKHLAVEETQIRTTLRRCARVGMVYPVAHDHYYARASVSALAAVAARISADRGGVSAARFRDAIGTGRKLAIHILEFFDRVGFTRRVKDLHIIRNPHLFQQESAVDPQEGRETSPGGAAGLQIR